MLSGKCLRHLGEERLHQGTHRLHLDMPVENDSQLVLLIEYRLLYRLIPWIRLPNPVQKRDLPLPELTAVVCAPCLDGRGAIPLGSGPTIDLKTLERGHHTLCLSQHPRSGRDLLRPVFLTRSEGVQMEAGELSEAEVELEVVEPWDTRVNMFGA
jgi:hypothetical protein